MQLKNCSISPTITPSSEELASLKGEIKNLSSQLAEKELERLSLEDQLKQLHAENTRFMRDSELAKEQIKKLQEQHLASKETIDKHKEAQLERVVQFMRTRIEETELEKSQWQEKTARLENSQEKLLGELQETKNAQVKLTEAMRRQEEEKQELLQEDIALKAQLDQLRGEVEKYKECLLFHSESENRHQETLACAHRELALLKDMMAQSLQTAKEERAIEEQALQGQIVFLKQEHDKQLGQSVDAAKRIETQIKDITSLQENLAALAEKEAALSKDLDAEKRAYQELAQFAEEIKLKLMQNEEDKKTQQDMLLKKEELINKLSTEVAQLANQKEKLEERERLMESDRQEYEMRLRQASQHLAKKLRETALLEEQAGAFQTQIESQEKAQETLKSKLAETKALLDKLESEKHTLQKQHQDQLKSLEAQLEKWEQKYMNLQEKWQESEAKNREFKRLEERFSKLQSIFNHLGTIITAPLAHDTFDPSHFTAVPQARKVPEKEIILPDPTPIAEQPSLFEASAKNARYQETLFG